MELFPGTLYFARPWGLLALVLPLSVLLASWVGRRPRELSTGTLELWRDLGPEAEAAGVRRAWRLPFSRLLLLAALVSGALALAGPRFAGAPAGNTWRIIVDRSPSMYLPWEAAGQAIRGTGGDPKGRTRLAAALEMLHELPGAGEATFIWEDPGQVFGGTPVGPEPSGPDLPRGWELDPAKWGVPRAAVDWAGRDEAGVIWLTDHEPELGGGGRRRAGLVASGGAAVPGWVAWERELRFAWDGSGKLVRETCTDAPPLVLFQNDVPGPLRRFIEVWAADRGLRISGEAEAGPRLRVVGPRWVDEVPVTVGVGGAGGWSLSGTATRGGAPPFPLGLQPPGAPTVLETRLASSLDGAPWVLVSGAPGHLELAWRSLEEPGGDPAAFAVWWGSLLDELLLDPPGVLPLAERLAAGEPRAEGPDRAGGPAPNRFPVSGDLPLAGLALALACAWAFLDRRGPRRRPQSTSR